MVDYKQVLRLRAEGVSQRGISDVLGCSRNTVAAVVAAAVAAGIGYAQVAGRSPDEVRALLLTPAGKPGSDRTAPDFEWVHRELGRPAVTLLLLWNGYVADCRTSGGVPYQYSFFNEQYRRWVGATGATMRIVRDPAEQTEVDWAGDTMSFIDPASGEVLPAFLFVAALSYSALTFVEAFPDMTLPSWIEAHVDAFEFFGGTTRLLTPDNLRTGVTRADRYEPVLNTVYARLADHYGTAIIPARVRRPRDKPVVEGSVRFVANQIAATLRDRRFVGLVELNDAIAEQVEVINTRPFQKREDSRRVVFERDERRLLNPLPMVRFELAELRTARVGPNYHVQIDRNHYSVPATLIGQSVDVRVTSHTIEVFCGVERVASHQHLVGVRGRYATVPAHMPDAHRARLIDWTPARFVGWAATIGPNTQQAIEAILASRQIVEQTFRSCLGVMSLAKRAGGAT